MRILHVIKIGGLAGAEKHVLELVDALRTQGLDARICVLADPAVPIDDVYEEIRRRGIPFETFPARKRLNWAVRRHLIDEFRRVRPDIVHTHLIHADFYAVPAARRAEVPAVVSTRHDQLGFRRRWSLRALNRWLLRHTDACIAVSHAVARFLVETEGAPANRVHVIPNALDPTPFSRDERASVRAELAERRGVPVDAIVLGVFGRLVPEKGVEHALDAFARLTLPGDAGCRLLIVGDGALRSELEARARTLRIEDQVRFLGWRHDVPRLLAGCDVFLMPSLSEGFGLSLLESAAAGVPAVASRVGGIPEILIDGETGILVPPADVDALATATRALVADTNLRASMGARARARFLAAFTLDRAVEATVALYHSVLERSLADDDSVAGETS